MEAPLVGSLPLQHHGPLRHQVTPAVMRAGNAARSLRERSANGSAHLVKITTDSMMSELWRPGLYIEAFLPDVVHQTHEAGSVVKYPYAVNNV